MKLQSPGIFALLAVQVLAARPPLDPDAVVSDVKSRALQAHLEELDKIAVSNGGNRAFGEPGYLASRNYVQNRIKNYGYHMKTYLQSFTTLYEKTNSISLQGPDGENVKVLSPRFNTGTPLPSGVSGYLVDQSVDDERGSGCFADQWEATSAAKSIVLIKRGGCPVADKVIFAKKHGALAVLLVEEEPGKVTTANLRSNSTGLIVPVGLISEEQGRQWSERLAAGESLEATLVVDHLAEERESWNVFAETREGDPNNIVMLGAHLDSVQAGPGINDDGSGSSALLSLMESFDKYSGLTNKVRFAWWGAEENGLIGSRYYGSKLSSEEADKIRFYFNYDMIGSMTPNWSAYANTDGDRMGATLLRDFMSDKGTEVPFREFGSSSDYVAFRQLGIPSSGLFTGSSPSADPYYHQSCDDTNNINQKAMFLATQAAGYAAARLALSLEGVPPRQVPSAQAPAKAAKMKKARRRRGRGM